MFSFFVKARAEAFRSMSAYYRAGNPTRLGGNARTIGRPATVRPTVAAAPGRRPRILGR